MLHSLRCQVQMCHKVLLQGVDHYDAHLQPLKTCLDLGQHRHKDEQSLGGAMVVAL